MTPSPTPTEIAKPTELTISLCEPDEMDVEGMITMDTIERCPACHAVCGNNPLPTDPNHPHNPCKYHFQVRCYSCDYRGPVKSADDQEMAYNSAARSHNAVCRPAPETQAVTIPDGFALVPKEPTEEMLESACEAADEAVSAELARIAQLRKDHPTLGKGIPISRGRNICQAHWDKQFYSALLAAAPKFPIAPVESAPALAPFEKPKKEPETFELSNEGSFLDLGGYF